MTTKSTDENPLAGLLSPEQVAKLGSNLGKMTSEEAPTYTMRDAGEESKTPGFDEAASAAFDYLKATPTAHAITYSSAPQLSLVASSGGRAHGAKAEGKITARDAAAVAAELVSACIAAGVGQAEIDSIVKEILSAIGAPKARLHDIAQAARTAADKAIHEAMSEKHETKEQKVERLREEIKGLSKEVASEMEKAHKRGDISDENMKIWREMKAKADALPDGEEKDAAIQALAKFEGKVLQGVADKATAEGHHDHASSAGAASTKAKQIDIISDDLAKIKQANKPIPSHEQAKQDMSESEKHVQTALSKFIPSSNISPSLKAEHTGELVPPSSPSITKEKTTISMTSF